MGDADRDSKTAILKAAVIEFATHGKSGARMEHIATRSGFNKALVYRYFKNREALFADALAFTFAKKLKVTDAVPKDLGDALVFWFDTAGADRRFLKLVMREALDHEGGELAHEASRRDYYDGQLRALEGWREQGQIDPALPLRPLLLLLSGAVSFPSFFPTLTRLIMGGQSVGDEAFKDEWRQLLRELARRLAPRDAPDADADGAR